MQEISFWLNEEEFFLDDDDDDDDDEDDFSLDLDDPWIALQYYDRDDYRYYLAMEQLTGGYDSDSEIFLL